MRIKRLRNGDKFGLYFLSITVAFYGDDNSTGKDLHGFKVRESLFHPFVVLGSEGPLWRRAPPRDHAVQLVILLSPQGACAVPN